MSLNGLTLSVTWRFPDIDTILSGGNIEITDGIELNYADENVDISQDLVTFTTTQTGAPYLIQPFNGFSIEDFNDVLPDIGGITILINNFSYDSSRTAFDAEHVTIEVGGLEAPETTLLQFRLELTPYDMALAAAPVMENTTGAVIGALTVADLNDADTHTFDVDDARFEVVDGMLKLRDGVALDFETASAIDVTVTAADSFDLSYQETFTIDVIDGVDRIVGDDDGGKLKGTNGDDILRGRRGDDILLGKTGDDNLRSVGGDDILKGGKGADTFVFSTGSRRDTIADFAGGIDHIDLSKWTAIEDYADVKSHAKNHGDDVWITAGKDILVIKDMHKSDLEPGDFGF